jgi:hypothetical protein
LSTFRSPGKRLTRSWAGYLRSRLKLSFVVFWGAAERPDAESPRKAKQTIRTIAF